MRRLFLSVVLLLVFVPSWSELPPRPLYYAGATLRAERVALYPGDPGRTDLGAMTYLGGVRLIGNQDAFGGFSSMQVHGNHFILLSDGGVFVRFDLDSDWRVLNVRFDDLPDGPAFGWEKGDRDSESMTTDPARGQAWVGFERYNEIWRYDIALRRAEGFSAPPAMAKWDLNTGAEAMVRLNDGRFVVLGEQTISEDGALRAGVVFAGDPVRYPRAAYRFAYRPPSPEYAATDVAQLPDGRLLVLNRAFAPIANFTTIITVVDPRAIRPGVTVSGRPVARLAPPTLADNFEAMALTREGADTILWIASDDNQFFLQQSLLLKFRVNAARP